METQGNHAAGHRAASLALPRFRKRVVAPRARGPRSAGVPSSDEGPTASSSALRPSPPSGKTGSGTSLPRRAAGRA